MSHTPGPWNVSLASRGRVIILGGIEGLNNHDPNPGKMHCIAEMYRPMEMAVSVNEADDARLIAAAPDLLAALKAFVGRYPGNVGVKDALKAIAKAEGKQ